MAPFRLIKPSPTSFAVDRHSIFFCKKTLPTQSFSTVATMSHSTTRGLCSTRNSQRCLWPTLHYDAIKLV
ncbi:unnamed protein product [Prunus armeniaca]